MSLTITLIALIVSAAAFLFANHKSRQPVDPGTVRLIPYQGIQFVALLGVVLMLAHLVTLLTGEPLVGRFSRF